MKKVLLFEGTFNYSDLAKLSGCELYKIARSAEVNDEAARVLDLEDLQHCWNVTPEELRADSTWMFFIDVYVFHVEVPDFQIEKFNNDYELFIEDSVVRPYETHLCTLTAPIEVRKEIEGLYEEGIFII